MTNLVWVRDASSGVGCERLGGDDRTPFPMRVDVVFYLFSRASTWVCC